MESKSNELFTTSSKVLWIVRLFLVATAISIAADGIFSGSFALGMAILVVTLSVCVLVIVMDIATKSKDITTVSAIAFGLLAGCASLASLSEGWRCQR